MTHQLAAGCALAASVILTVQLLPPAISKIIMPVRTRNLGMAAPRCCPIRSRRYCAVSRNLWTPFVLPLSTALFHFRVVWLLFAAIRHDSSLVHLFESDQCAVQLSSSIDEGGGKRRSTSNKSRTKIAKPSAASWGGRTGCGGRAHTSCPPHASKRG
jgi:hypothetical protein